MSSLPSKESILDSFSQFFRKVVNNHPLKDELIQNLTTFNDIVLSDNANYLQTKTFISSLYNRNLIKTSQNQQKPSQSSTISNTLPHDPSLKTFVPEKLRYPFSLLSKFTYTSFKDYLAKNSISLSTESTLMHKFSHLREFLPDSQNFYRALGLGLLETYLSDSASLHRISEWYTKVFYKDIVLSTQVYAFPSEELRLTFCGYLKQLLEAREEEGETYEAKKSRNLLYQMDSKDTIFDISLVSFVKEFIISKLSSSKENFNGLGNRIKANDSTIIEDLFTEIPQIFDVNLIVEIIQNKTVTEIMYNLQEKDSKLYPTLHILNEKQLSYQNFCILNVDNLDEEVIIETKPAISHLRNQSLQRFQPSNPNPKPEKAFSTELKAASERIEKNVRLPQVYGKKGIDLNSSEDINNSVRTISENSLKEAKPHPLQLLTEGEGPKSDEEDQIGKLPSQEETAPEGDVISLSKILNGYLGPKKRKLEDELESPGKSKAKPQDQSYKAVLNIDDTSKQIKTPEKLKSDNNTESPINVKTSPIDFDLTPTNQQEHTQTVNSLPNIPVQVAIDLTAPVKDLREDNTLKPIKLKQEKTTNVNNFEVLQERANKETIRDNPILSGDGKVPQIPNIGQMKDDIEFFKPKIVTMVPKCMSTLPCNPFSMGASANPMSANPMNVNPMNANPMSGYASSNRGSQPEFNLNENRDSIKNDSMSQEKNYYLPQAVQNGSQRRFSLNPLSYVIQGDRYDRKYGFGEGGNKHLNRSGQDERNNENSGLDLERRASHKPSANVSLGAYGYNEKRIY